MKEKKLIGYLYGSYVGVTLAPLSALLIYAVINQGDFIFSMGIIQILFLGCLMGIYLLLVCYFVSQKISASIKLFVNGMDEISKGNMSYQLPILKIQELRILSESFNNMATTLNTQMRKSITHLNEKELILSNMVEGIITVDLASKITTINQIAKSYFCDLNDIVEGTPLNEVIRNTTIQTMIQKCLATSDLISCDIKLMYPKEIYLHAHGRCLKSNEQGCMGALIVLHDVTHIKKLEEMRKEFVSNVSHELKTPITVIKGFLETLLTSDVETKQEQDEFLTIIQNNTDRLDRIIDDLLSLSQIEKGNENESIKLKPEQLNTVVEKAILYCQGNASKKEISLSLKSNITRQSKINASLMEQAIINLIDNAIKYSPEKNEIQVATSETSLEHVITVSDNGCGVPQKHIPHLFERFYRVDSARSRELGGTGLGLAIVKHIAYAHNGNVSIKSIEGKGSQFSIHIPFNITHLKEKKHV